MTLAEILIGRGYAVPCANDETTKELWKVSPDLLTRVDGNRIELHMLRLKKPGSLLDLDALPEVTTGLIENESITNPESENTAAPIITALIETEQVDSNSENTQTPPDEAIHHTPDLDDVLTGFEINEQPNIEESVSVDFNIAEMKSEAVTTESLDDIFGQTTTSTPKPQQAIKEHLSANLNASSHIVSKTERPSVDVNELINEVVQPTLKRLLSEVHNKKQSGILKGEEFYLAYPKMAEMLGEPLDVLNSLRTEKAIESVKGKPAVFLHDAGGTKAIALKKRLVRKHQELIALIASEGTTDDSSIDSVSNSSGESTDHDEFSLTPGLTDNETHEENDVFTGTMFDEFITGKDATTKPKINDEISFEHFIETSEDLPTQPAPLPVDEGMPNAPYVEEDDVSANDKDSLIIHAKPQPKVVHEPCGATPTSTLNISSDEPPPKTPVKKGAVVQERCAAMPDKQTKYIESSSKPHRSNLPPELISEAIKDMAIKFAEEAGGQFDRTGFIELEFNIWLERARSNGISPVNAKRLAKGYERLKVTNPRLNGICISLEQEVITIKKEENCGL